MNGVDLRIPLELAVAPSERIRGQVQMRVHNGHGSSAVFPVEAVPTWGAHESNWWTVARQAPSGWSLHTARIDLVAPSRPGTYYLFFACAAQQNGGYIASATAWPLGLPVFNDGNDMADWGEEVYAQAVRRGWASFPHLEKEGMGYSDYGVAGIKIKVGAPSATATGTTRLLAPEEIAARYDSMCPRDKHWRSRGRARFLGSWKKGGNRVTGIRAFYACAVEVGKCDNEEKGDASIVACTERHGWER